MPICIASLIIEIYILLIHRNQEFNLERWILNIQFKWLFTSN